MKLSESCIKVTQRYLPRTRTSTGCAACVCACVVALHHAASSCGSCCACCLLLGLRPALAPCAAWHGSGVRRMDRHPCSWQLRTAMPRRCRRCCPLGPTRMQPTRCVTGCVPTMIIATCHTHAAWVYAAACVHCSMLAVRQRCTQGSCVCMCAQAAHACVPLIACVLACWCVLGNPAIIAMRVCTSLACGCAPPCLPCGHVRNGAAAVRCGWQGPGAAEADEALRVCVGTHPAAR